MLLSYKWVWMDGMGWVGSLWGATLRASLRDANNNKMAFFLALCPKCDTSKPDPKSV